MNHFSKLKKTCFKLYDVCRVPEYTRCAYVYYFESTCRCFKLVSVHMVIPSA